MALKKLTEFRHCSDGIVHRPSSKKKAEHMDLTLGSNCSWRWVKSYLLMVSGLKNPYKNWSDVDASLPNKTKQVMGPPPTSGTT